jgi:hypothetical protein
VCTLVSNGKLVQHHVFQYGLHGFAGPYGVRRCTFADAEQEDVHPISKNGLTVSSKPGATFQVMPRQGEADGFLPNTSHRSGMLAAMLDGSVRSYSPPPSQFSGQWSRRVPAKSC